VRSEGRCPNPNPADETFNTNPYPSSTHHPCWHGLMIWVLADCWLHLSQCCGQPLRGAVQLLPMCKQLTMRTMKKQHGNLGNVRCTVSIKQIESKVIGSDIRA